MSNKNNRKREELENEFERIQEEHSGLDISNYIGSIDDLPDAREMVVYDYESELVNSLDVATEILESLVDMYLGDQPEFKEHRYIQNKMKEDAAVYANTIFLSNMTRKNLLTQLKQIDAGEQSARSHEVVNQTFKEMRENAKYQQTQRTDLEKFYRDFRKDFGLKDLSENNDLIDTNGDGESGTIMDNKSMNDMIDNYFRNKND